MIDIEKANALVLRTIHGSPPGCHNHGKGD